MWRTANLHWGWICFGGMLLCILPTMSLRAQTANSKPPEAKPSPTQMLVFLRAEHPVFVQLTVLVDGQELRTARQQRVDLAFDELDTNKDGYIDQAERDAQPKALRKLGVRDKWMEL